MAETTYLPDVNVLFAAHRSTHEFHGQALAWLRAAESFATCAITEQGLVRLLSSPIANPGATVDDALAALARVRSRRAHVFWADQASLGDPRISLTGLVGHKQITAFHLVNLAAAHGGVLATFDTRIVGALAPKDRRHGSRTAGGRPHHVAP